MQSKHTKNLNPERFELGTTLSYPNWSITRSQHKARKNVHERATIGFGFTSDWLKKWRENFEPITEWSNAKTKVIR